MSSDKNSNKKEKAEDEQKSGNSEVEVKSKRARIAKALNPKLCLENLICCGGFSKKKLKITDIPEKGLNPKRGCTDCLFIIFFLLFWVGMIIIMGFALYHGNPKTLIEPTDYENNMCGYGLGQGNRNRHDLRNYTFLWYPFDVKIDDISQSQVFDAFYLGICVSECPKYPYPLDYVCDYEFKHLEGTLEGVFAAAQNGSGCYKNFFPTQPFGKRCIPSFDNVTISFATRQIFDLYVSTVLVFRAGWGEIAGSWPIIGFTIIFAVILCFAFVIAIRIVIGPCVYIFLFLVYISIMGLGGYFLYSGTRRWMSSEVDGIVIQEDRKTAQIFLGVGGALICVAMLYFFLMVYLIKRIACAIAIVQESSKAVVSMPSIFLIPFITFVFSAGIAAYWISIASFMISSTREVTLDPSYISSISSYINLNTTRTYTISRGDYTMQALQWYHLFGFLWTSALIMAISYTTISGAIVSWYFSGYGNKKRAPWFVAFRSFWIVIRYHLGSLILGSLFVAIVQFIRILFKYLSRYLKKSKHVKWIEKIVHCLLFILEKIVKFINQNAYIIMMIHGYNFCISAQIAFKLILTNILRVGATNFIGDFILILGQIGITFLGTLFCYIMIDQSISNNWPILASPISYGYLPTLVGCCIVFIITFLFMTVYRTAIDTLLMCFCADIDHNKGGKYFFPNSLKLVVSRFEVTPEKKEETKEKK